MTNDHTDIHAELSASVRAFAAREGGLARVRGLRDTPAEFALSSWHQCAELGWLGMRAPEALGGSELGVAEMAVVAREFGRALLPEPLTAVAVLAAGVLRHGRHGERLLSRLIKGELIAAVGWQERLGELDPGDVTTEITPSKSGARISGRKLFVAYGLGADGYAVSARAHDGVGLYWIDRDAAGVAYRSMRRADGSEHGELALDQVAVGLDNAIVAPGRGAQVLAAALDEAVLISAAELLGIAERTLEITLEFLRTRVQFGKPIGSFQGLQHRCVDLFIQKELGVSALTAALAAWPSAGDEARAAAASRVKARCADAALDICRQAIQMHGAMGFTDACDVGLYLKRALTLAAWLGNAQAHRRRYAALVVTRKAEGNEMSLEQEGSA